MKFVTELLDRIDALTLRERAAVFLAVLAVMFFIWNSYLMADINNKERLLKAQLQQKQAERMGLNVELQNDISQGQEDPNALARKKLDMLREQLQEVKAQVMKATGQLVPPGKMADILEHVLASTRGLDLLQVKGLGSSALLKTDNSKDGKQAESAGSTKQQAPADVASPQPLDNAYKHGLKIVFNGSYMSTLEYVKKLEALHSGFLWDRLELKVKNYPDTEVAITVYTLSLDDNWIGV